MVCNGISCRLIFVFWGFVGILIVYLLRVNLSIAIVAMINGTESVLKNNLSECPDHMQNNSNPLEAEGEFNWSERQRGLVLGAFFWGYILTQIPGSYLAHYYSAKWTFGIGVLCTSVFTLVTPIAAKISIYLLIVVRVIEGLGEAVTFPALYTLLGRWAPPLERSRLFAITVSGQSIGTIIGQPISGVLCNSNILGGWPSVFYLCGGVGIVWFLFWIYYVYDHPDKHPRISYAEKHYILSTVEVTTKNSFSRPIPWSRIFRSPAYLCLIVSHFCTNWSWYTMLTCLPTYMSKVLRFNINDDGFLSSLPYVFNWFSILFAGVLVDHLMMRFSLPTAAVRKTATGIGLLGVAGGLIGAGYVGCDYKLAIFFFCLGFFLFGFIQPGFQTSFLDIAPQFAGATLSVSNSIATIPGILGPYVVGFVTESGETKENWLIIFYIAACLAGVGFFSYLIFGSSELQHWAIEDDEMYISRSQDGVTRNRNTDSKVVSVDASLNDDLAY